MFGLGERWSEQDGSRPSVLWTTVKGAVLISLVSYGAATWLSSSMPDDNAAVRVAGRAGYVDDPVTTGSIGPSSGAAMRLDPCTIPRRP